MTYILKLQKGDKVHTVFADDYATNQNDLDVLFSDKWYFLTGVQVVEVNEQVIPVDPRSTFNNIEILRMLEAE